MKLKSFILVLFLFVSCCSHRETVEARTRSFDTISELRSVSSRRLKGETVWQTVILKPDTSGVFVEVERQVTKKTYDETETTADTAVTEAKSEVSETVTVTEDKETPAAPRTTTTEKVALATLAFVFFGLFVFCFYKYLQQRWNLLK